MSISGIMIFSAITEAGREHKKDTLCLIPFSKLSYFFVSQMSERLISEVRNIFLARYTEILLFYESVLSQS